MYLKPAIFRSPPTKNLSIPSSMPVTLFFIFLLSWPCKGRFFFILLNVKILERLLVKPPSVYSEGLRALSRARSTRGRPGRAIIGNPFCKKNFPSADE
jgi:hypothetical protein